MKDALFTIRPTSTTLKRISALLPEEKLRQINISGVNDATRWGETQLNRLVRRTLNLSRDRVDEAIYRITTGDDASGFSQVIRVARKKIDLMDFHPTETRRGVAVRIQKGKRELIRKAFLAKRKGGVYSRIGVKRKPIRRLKGGTPIGAVLRHEPEIQPILEGMADRVVKRTESKLLLALKNMGGTV
jgi:hypothetical protein